MLETKVYNEIIVTRVTVPVGEDIGFLPGTEEEKMSPWMGAFDDNLDLLFLAIEAVSVPVPITALCRLLVGRQ